jgi:hypothetical protein
MILVDAHVHIHDCFNLELFLNAAAKNFKNAAERLHAGTDFRGLLLLAESLGANSFTRLCRISQEKHEQNRIGNWKLYPTSEKEVLRLANRITKETLFVIAGRQIVTAEHLEVLSILNHQTYDDGYSIEHTIRRVLLDGGVCVLPWGFGKWMGNRGKILTRLIETSPSRSMFLGDNGGRPVLYPQPCHFKLAKQYGIRTLPGSDPLPFASENERAGSFGFALNESISDDTPAKDLVFLLNDQSKPFLYYGRLESPGRFFKNQLAMQIKRRLNPKRK